MENELIHFFKKDENKYKEKKELCLDLINTIQKKFDDLQLKKGDKNHTEIDNIVDNIAKEVISLKKYEKYKSDFEKVLPSYINLLKENIRYKVFDKIEIGCKANGDLFLQPSFTFTPKIDNSFDRLKFELWQDYATGIIEVDYTQKKEFEKLKNYLLSNLDVSNMLVHIICEYFNRYIKQFNRTKEIFESSKIIYNSLTSKQKELLKKNKLLDRKFIKQLDKNIILEEKTENIRKQRGTINQYFNEWESKSISVPKGQKEAFYYDEFITNKSGLKDYPYENFKSNLKAQNSIRKKALRKG